MDWAKTTARQDKKHFNFLFGATYIRGLTVFYVLPVSLKNTILCFAQWSHMYSPYCYAVVNMAARGCIQQTFLQNIWCFHHLAMSSLTEIWQCVDLFWQHPVAILSLPYSWLMQCQWNVIFVSGDLISVHVSSFENHVPLFYFDWFGWFWQTYSQWILRILFKLNFLTRRAIMNNIRYWKTSNSVTYKIDLIRNDLRIYLAILCDPPFFSGYIEFGGVVVKFYSSVEITLYLLADFLLQYVTLFQSRNMIKNLVSL